MLCYWATERLQNANKSSVKMLEMTNSRGKGQINREIFWSITFFIWGKYALMGGLAAFAC